MKKITLAVTAFFFFQLANAQVEKGSIFTGGSIGVSKSNVESATGDKTSGFNWNISPQIGKAIAQNKVIGMQFSVGGNTNENTNPGGSTAKSNGKQLGVGVFYRQYFSIYKKWMFYGQGNANVNFSNSSSSAQGIKFQQSKSISGALTASLGITYQLSKKLWLEAGLSDLVSIGYSHQKSESLSPAGVVTPSYKNDNLSANFNLNGSNSLSIGFRWIIPAK
jgi:hypothetical protein